MSALSFVWILTFSWLYMLSLYFSLQILLSNVFLRNHQYIICNFGGWPQNYLTTPEAFWTSMLHCFRPTVQFSREISSRTYSIVLARCLWSLFLTFVVLMKLSHMIDCIHSIEFRCEDGRYGFEISWKHRRLVFVFSMEI